MPKSNAAEVFERYRRQLAAFIARRVGPGTDVEDLLQEVFLRFVQAEARSPITEVAAWLFRTTRNRIIDLSRKRREIPLPERHPDDEEEGLVGEITALLADDSRSPEMEYLRSLVWEELERALDELPAAQRDIFCLTEFEGLPFRLLSEQMDIPVTTLLSRKHAAVRHLRRRLADIYQALLAE